MLYVRLANAQTNYKYGTIGFTHHSNGQDGEAITGNRKLAVERRSELCSKSNDLLSINCLKEKVKY